MSDKLTAATPFSYRQRELATMLKRNKNHLILAVAVVAATSAHAIAEEAELLAVLRSGATLQEKSPDGTNSEPIFFAFTSIL